MAIPLKSPVSHPLPGTVELLGHALLNSLPIFIHKRVFHRLRKPQIEIFSRAGNFKILKRQLLVS